MGYTTDFNGTVFIEPALSAEEVKFINKFSETRRMECKQGPYYVDRSGFAGQDDGEDVINHNSPPAGQPGLWCQWIVSEDGEHLSWNDGEKFYNSPEWMVYIIEHFLCRHPVAQAELPFLKGHLLNGTISAQGEEPSDMWMLYVVNNQVSTEGIGAGSNGIKTHIGGEKFLALPSKD